MSVIDRELHHKRNKVSISNSVLKSKPLYTNLPSNQRVFKMNHFKKPFFSRWEDIEESMNNVIICSYSDSWINKLKQKMISTA